MPIGDFSIGDIARAVWDLLTRLDIDTCFVVGHSLGGYVTLEMADQHPDRLSGFCMFHSTAYADDAPKKLNRTKVMEFVAKNGTPPFVQTLIPSLFATPKHAILESLLQEASQISPLTVIGYARAMRDRPDRTQVYVTFPNPILFFAGMKDSIIPLESIWKQSEIAHHKVVHELAGTAHMGMLEASMEAEKVLLNFLEEAH